MLQKFARSPLRVLLESNMKRQCICSDIPKAVSREINIASQWLKYIMWEIRLQDSEVTSVSIEEYDAERFNTHLLLHLSDVQRKPWWFLQGSYLVRA